MAKPHVLIAGAGIGGLTSGLALSQNGISVDIFEQAPTIEDVGAGLQLSPNAMHVLAALGLKEAIESTAFEPQFTAFRDYRTGRPELMIPMKGPYETRYGAKYLHIHRADLHRILMKAALASGVKLHTAVKVKNYTQTLDYISVNTGAQQHKGDVLVGADGIQSAIQAKMLSLQAPKFTKQVAWRGIVPTSALSKGTLAPAANNWIGPGQHFVSYYIRGGELINFVAVKEQADWSNESWQQTGDLNQLRKTFAGWDRPVTAILDACEACYLWGLFDRQPLEKWTDGRAALLGDAAHPMLPFAAQGAAMAIEDSWVLAQKLLTIGDVPSALRAYETARKPRTSKIQSTSEKNAKLFHENRRLSLAKRRLIFRIGSIVKTARNHRLDPIFCANVTRDHPIS